MVGTARDERSPVGAACAAFPLVPVVGKHPCTAAGDDRLFCIDDRYLFTGKRPLGGDACKAPEEQSVKIAALNFSASATSKIKDAKGQCMTIEQLISDNPKGSGVRILR
jgi:hypothetical protein